MKRLLMIGLMMTGLARAAVPVEPEPEITKGAEETWNIGWWGSPAHTYFLQYSVDLVDWFYFPRIEAGMDDELEWGFFSDGDDFFVRVQYTNQAYEDPELDDYDGDGLTNWFEVHWLNTDPCAVQTAWHSVPDLQYDGDLDGVPDYREFEIFGNLDSADAQTDFDGDGLSYALEIGGFIQTDPFDPDTDHDGIPDGEDPDPLVLDATINTVTELKILTPLTS